MTSHTRRRRLLSIFFAAPPAQERRHFLEETNWFFMTLEWIRGVCWLLLNDEKKSYERQLGKSAQVMTTADEVFRDEKHIFHIERTFFSFFSASLCCSSSSFAVHLSLLGPQHIMRVEEWKMLLTLEKKTCFDVLYESKEENYKFLLWVHQLTVPQQRRKKKREKSLKFSLFLVRIGF